MLNVNNFAQVHICVTTHEQQICARKELSTEPKIPYIDRVGIKRLHNRFEVIVIVIFMNSDSYPGQSVIFCVYDSILAELALLLKLNMSLIRHSPRKNFRLGISLFKMFRSFTGQVDGRNYKFNLKSCILSVTCILISVLFLPFLC